MSEIGQTERVPDEELDQMIWKLERDDMTPKMLSLMRELREVRKAKPVGITERSEIECLKRGEMANVMPVDYKGVDSGDEVFVYTSSPSPVALNAEKLNQPVSETNDSGWIPVSERMPMDGFDVLCATEFDGPGDWRRKVGNWHCGKWVVYGASWTPTHWQPLPATPNRNG